MRFHLDEHVDHAVADGLAMRGIDVTTTVAAGLLSADDSEHIAFALRENRVIVTGDVDFLDWHRQGLAHQGIVFVPQHRMRIGNVVRGILLVNACLTDDQMRGHVEFL